MNPYKRIEEIQDELECLADELSRIMYEVDNEFSSWVASAEGKVLSAVQELNNVEEQDDE